MRRVALVVLITIVIVCIGGWVFAHTWSISAQNPPGTVERIVASRAKHYFVARAANAGVPAETANIADSVSNGQTIYGSLCAGCHGYDGRTPTKQGRSMSPRTPSLAGGMQGWSNPELFVIIRDGLRMTGMPAFGTVERSEEIWDVVHYVRSIPAGNAQR